MNINNQQRKGQWLYNKLRPSEDIKDINQYGRIIADKLFNITNDEFNQHMQAYDVILVDIAHALLMRNKINTIGIISSISPPRTINLKIGGTISCITTELKDESGSINLVLWGDDISKVKIGSKVKILNGYTNVFKNEVSLSKGKYGELIVLEY